MDIPRGPATALPLPLRNNSSRHKSRRSSPPSPIRHDDLGMPIPGANREHVPPALPPPRYVNDYGCDLAWSLQNRLHTHRQDSTDGFIKPGSSLHGGYATNGLDQDHGTHMDVDIRWDRRDSAVTTVHHPTRSASTPKLSLPQSARSSMDLSSSAINPEFHGEQPLAQQNHSQAIHAYDKEVLRKIGKGPSTQPLCTRTISSDHSQFERRVSVNSRTRSPVRSILTDSVLVQDRSSQPFLSPNSTTSTSPNSRYLRSEHHTTPRSPSYESSSFSARTDQEASWHRQLAMNEQQQQQQFGSIARGSGDTTNLQHRGSYDSSTGVPDPDLVSDNVGSLTQQIRDRPHREPFPGMKRRALSRPVDLVTEQDPDSTLGAQSFGRYALADSSRQPKFGSVSSTTSSVRHNSYTSSVLSAAPSSLTSISSFDTRSPSDLPQSIPYITSVKPTSSPSATSAPLRSLDDEPVAERTTSLQPPAASRQPLPTRIGNSFICSCCLKKPKKFATEEQLRAHESEKQYICAYCPHRFKNKNEAERHQNSLHLRKHSWSCAAIRQPHDAFHPSNSSNKQPSATDICGFCGEEFPNQPLSMNARLEHLTNIHKFAECNSTKKFFRADHFRQHLKHSHGGKSGKWTNVLENTCLREEYAPESASLSPAGSEHSQGTVNRSLTAGSNPTERPSDGVRIFDDRYPR